MSTSNDDPSNMKLILRDSFVRCRCPAGTLRRATDIALFLANPLKPIWMHVPCKPFYLDLPCYVQDQTASLAKCIEATQAHPTAITRLADIRLLPPLILHKDFDRSTSFKILCDGPCTDSKTPAEADFLRCKKCLTWQHRPCMLYGQDPRENGLPVCNICYVDLLVHHDSFQLWQRMRLQAATIDASRFLLDRQSHNHQAQRDVCIFWLQQAERKLGPAAVGSAKEIARLAGLRPAEQPRVAARGTGSQSRVVVRKTARGRTAVENQVLPAAAQPIPTPIAPKIKSPSISPTPHFTPINGPRASTNHHNSSPDIPLIRLPTRPTRKRTAISTAQQAQQQSQSNFSSPDIPLRRRLLPTPNSASARTRPSRSTAPKPTEHNLRPPIKLRLFAPKTPSPARTTTTTTATSETWATASERVRGSASASAGKEGLTPGS